MRRTLLPAATLLPVAALLLAAASPPPVPLYRTFGRWVVACDNVRRCEARGFDERTRADLRVIVEAGPATPAVTLTWDEQPTPSGFTLDGQPIELSPPTWSLDARNQTLSTKDPAAAAAFIAAARNAATLGWGRPQAGEQANSVPLQGFVAALLLIDAVQGRPGTPAALAAPRGKDGVHGAPGLPARPAWHAPTPLAAAEARQLLAATANDPQVVRALRQADCSSTDRPGIDALDPAHALILIPCRLGAYQGWSLTVIMPRGGGPATLFGATRPGLPAQPDDRRGFLTEAGFDPATGELGTSAKGRGLADCGDSASWVWSAGAFRLTALNNLDQCGGAMPGDWPALYRSRAPR